MTRDLKRDEDAWTEYATSLAFSEDGSHLVVGLIDYGGFVRRLLDLRTFRALVVADLGKPSMTVTKLQQPNPFVVINTPLSHDNYQGEIAVWDAETGGLRYKTNERRHQVLSLSFSPDGRMLATGGRDGRIVFRNADSGKSLFEMKMDLPVRGGARAVVESLAFSPNGKILAAGTGSWNIGKTERWGEVRLIDVEERTIQSVPLRDHVHVPHHVAFSANGKMVAATTVDGKLFVWDLCGHDGNSEGQ